MLDGEMRLGVGMDKNREKREGDKACRESGEGADMISMGSLQSPVRRREQQHQCAMSSN